jgi:ankyrin repeat protein
MSVNLTNTGGNTPLHLAAACGNVEATKTLVKRGADLNEMNIIGFTPIMMALYNKKLEVVYYLMEISADIHVPHLIS